MCFPKVFKRQPVERQRASCSTSKKSLPPPQRPTGSAASGRRQHTSQPIFDNVRKSKSQGSKKEVAVADVHRLWRSERGKQQKLSDPAKRHQQVVEAMTVLGCSSTHTTFADRMNKASATGSERSSIVGRTGDISFTMSLSASEDTVFPMAGEKPSTEDRDQEVEEEPCEENYMWNTQEIRYTCVIMMRNLDKQLVLEAAGERSSSEEPAWDPMAPLELLESRSWFDCRTLRRHTFISTVQCCSTKSEQEGRKKSKTPTHKPVVTFLGDLPLTQFQAAGVSLRTATTVATTTVE